MERDKRKKTLSGRNGIKQFDVLPGYDLEELLASVAEVVYPSMSKEGLLNFVSDATTRARGISVQLCLKLKTNQ